MSTWSRGLPERSWTLPFASRTHEVPGASGGSVHGASAPSTARPPASADTPESSRFVPVPGAAALALHAADARPMTRRTCLIRANDGPGRTRCHMDLAPFPSPMAWMSSGARPFLESGTERCAEAASRLVSRLRSPGDPRQSRVMATQATFSPTGVKVTHLSFSATRRVRSGRLQAPRARIGPGAIDSRSTTSGFKAMATCVYAAPQVSRRPL